MPEAPLAFTVSNRLEQLQIDAAASVDKRSDFWKALLNSELYVLSESDEKTGEEILHTWQGNGEDACGVFTSLGKLIAAMPPGTSYIKINARVIFESMAQEGLGTFINPRYEPMVRLRANELSAMLEGKYNEIKGSNT